ncbi:acetyl esterase/lipase [Herbihabitans rhizosphaerae]|uniref:Acetyl esterase/lipase n=1 Tax=Herbihabitans rhizosphaerae TaxID=1872711 RepID=A0A4Q7L3Z1_9PSEU|nr:alpha/beta hydrolase [Herbihabitans rhizosphaerae]RZS44339.1 acetyl esterase/lipase [Herbihabitans rhizosphaerae]
MSTLIDPAGITPSRASAGLAKVMRLASREPSRLAPPGALGAWLGRAWLAGLCTVGRIGPPIAHTPVRTRRVRGEWVGGVPSAGARIVYYIHGSGYIGCSPWTHRGLVSRVSAAVGRPAFSVTYRRAPEHRFPAAHEDVVNGFNWLLDNGFRSEDIIVAGDSAGGHLAFSLCGELRRLGIAQPAGVIAFSPLVDATFALASARERTITDPFVTARTARRLIGLYTRGSDPCDPRLDVVQEVGPDFPPVLLQAGERELLGADAVHFAEALNGAGGRCELQVWPGQVHVFQIVPFLPEARAALRHVARFAAALDSEIRPAAIPSTARPSWRPA